MGDTTITFDHMHIISKDPAASARWYADIFGGEIVQETEMRGAPHIVVDISGVRMLVRGKRPGENPSEMKPFKHGDNFMGHEQWGTDHFGFKVGGGFTEYCADIKAKGVAFLVDPLEIRPGTHIAFIKGPDDETIELVEG
jgi:catechol 2,3-dioxygenase-like lactoylglutathione lyase family enzyme